MDPAGHDRVGVGARVGVPASDAGGLLIPMKGKTGVLKNIMYRNSGRGGNHLERQQLYFLVAILSCNIYTIRKLTTQITMSIWPNPTRPPPSPEKFSPGVSGSFRQDPLITSEGNNYMKINKTDTTNRNGVRINAYQYIWMLRTDRSSGVVALDKD